MLTFLFTMHALGESSSNFSLLLSQCGVPLLLDRIKQGMVSCRVSLCVTFTLLRHCIHLSFQEASVFFKKRALIEEEYGKTLQKLSRTTSEVYALNDGKAG
jgi:hypothetical protein